MKPNYPSRKFGSYYSYHFGVKNLNDAKIPHARKTPFRKIFATITFSDGENIRLFLPNLMKLESFRGH